MAYAAVGMLWRTMNALAKSLEPSNCAAAWVGPKILRLAAWNASTTPAASGASGPTIVICICSSCANFTKSATLEIGTLIISGSVAVPALPGAT